MACRALFENGLWKELPGTQYFPSTALMFYSPDDIKAFECEEIATQQIF